MKIDNPPPFEDFDCYLNFHDKLGRWQVCIKHRVTGKRRTFLNSKFQMSVKLGRILEKEEQVDHVDKDKTNDLIGNLEIVTQLENIRRSKADTPAIIISFVCPHCGSSFIRQRRQSHIVKGGLRSFCSRSCGAKFYHSERALMAC